MSRENQLDCVRRSASCGHHTQSFLSREVHSTSDRSHMHANSARLDRRRNRVSISTRQGCEAMLQGKEMTRKVRKVNCTRALRILRNFQA